MMGNIFLINKKVKRWNMVYIFTALYCEAHAFIDFFHLKKDMVQTRFQVFYNEKEQIRLTITGVGMISAAAAVSSICTEYGAGQEDFLINIGIAAASEEKRQFFLCNKIFDSVTKRTFYPDILYHHPFLEVQVVTLPQPLEEIVNDSGYLYDMEAAAVYQSGAYFLGPHQMSFLKVVSDLGTKTHEIMPKEVEQIFWTNIEQIADYIRILKKAGKVSEKQEPDKEVFDRLCRDLHCSKAMADSLFFYLRYCVLSGIDYARVVFELYQEMWLPCKDKREGKICFEELKRRLL